METYNGHVRTPTDAIILFEACRIGLLPRVQRRLSEKERQSIKSGSVFVWDEREAGMRRWTDGKSWSASRVSGSFLTYREMEGKRSGGSLDRSANRDGVQGQDGDSDGGPDGYRYKPDGLMKQSFSIKTQQGQHLHLISYFSRLSVNAQNLMQPSNDPQLRHIRPEKGMYPDSTVHEQSNIPAVTRGPMHSPGYAPAPNQGPSPYPRPPPPYAYAPPSWAPPSPMHTPPPHSAYSHSPYFPSSQQGHGHYQAQPPMQAGHYPPPAAVVYGAPPPQTPYDRPPPPMNPHAPQPPYSQSVAPSTYPANYPPPPPQYHPGYSYPPPPGPHHEHGPMYAPTSHHAYDARPSHEVYHAPPHTPHSEQQQQQQQQQQQHHHHHHQHHDMIKDQRQDSHHSTTAAHRDGPAMQNGVGPQPPPAPAPPAAVPAHTSGQTIPSISAMLNGGDDTRSTGRPENRSPGGTLRGGLQDIPSHKLGFEANRDVHVLRNLDKTTFKQY